ncbi:MAG: 50S ribosomal protein L18 [Armatimonadetes bacterium]|nr:50S ribosomal protein L18 [Armatimonadota bacterium]
MKRHSRVRRKVHGTADRPRLCVFRSLKYIYAQVIDDDLGHTLAAASSQEKAVRTELTSTDDTNAAQKVGALVAERAKEAGIGKVIFDRGGYLYHGRIKALADAAREQGLEF